MARTPRLGRLPRAAPSFTNTVVSLEREAEAQRDRNIMAAWQNGGTFEGQQVTDAMVEAYWQGKLAGLSKTDPKYDEVKGTYDQIVYNVAESKISVLYKQGKIGEGAVAKFYLDWAKKVPVNSAFFRTLQEDAAQFSQAAKARARSAGAQAATASYNKVQTETQQGARLGSALTDWLTRVAQDNGLIGQKQDLTDFMLDGQNDPGKMESIISSINSQMHSNPAAWKATVDAIKALDPHWDGNLTAAYFSRAVAEQATTYSKMAAYATSIGKTSDAKKYAKLAGDTNSIGSSVASWPAASSYSRARAAFDAVMKDPSATDADRATAQATFAAQIDVISQQPGLQQFQANALRNDAAALRGDVNAAGQPSFYENFLGNQNLTRGNETAGGDQTGENAKFADFAAQQAVWQAALDANPAAYVYGSYTMDAQGNRVFDPSGKGPIGIIPKASVDQNPAVTPLVPVTTITGNVIMEAVVRHDVVVDDPSNPNGPGIVVGHAITTQSGGVSTTIYEIEDPKNPKAPAHWTPVNPFADGTTQTVDKDGVIHVHPAVAAPDFKKQATDLATANGLPALATAFSNGVPAAGTSWTTASDGGSTKTVTWNGTGFEISGTTVDATGAKQVSPAVPYQPTTDAQAQAIWDDSRKIVGLTPTMDFPTAAMAALVASKAQGDAAINAWASPQFQQLLMVQEVNATGGFNPDGSAVNPTALAALRDRDQFVARDLAASGVPNYGDTATDIFDKGARDELAQQRLAKFDRLVGYSPNAPKRGDTQSENQSIRLAQALTVPQNPYMNPDHANVPITPNSAPPLVNPDRNNTLTPSAPPPPAKVPDATITPKPIPLPAPTVGGISNTGVPTGTTSTIPLPQGGDQMYKTSGGRYQG